MTPAERLVWQLCEAWNEGDIDDAVSLAHPELVWHMSGTYPDLRDVYEGREGYRAFQRDFLSGWEEFTIDVERVEETSPGVVLLLGGLRGRARGGIEVEGAWGYVLRIEDDLIRYARSYTSWSEAEDAAARAAGGGA